MGHYGGLYRPKHRTHKASSSARGSETSSVASSLHDGSWASNSNGPRDDTSASAASLGLSGLQSSSGDAETYFGFGARQQEALLRDARANAAALLVDVVAAPDKWQLVTRRDALRVFELRADATSRVSSMVPPNGSQLAQHVHTMMATTRVRATLDDFMRILACPRRDGFQNVLACLFEDRLQLADVFTSFGAPVGVSGTSESEPEQFAVKYVAIQGRSARSNSSGALQTAGASSNVLKFGGKNRHHARRAARLQKNGAGANGTDGPASQQDDGLAMCLAEYATIRQGHALNDSTGDHRVGIISQHSVEDPDVTRYCKPIVTSNVASTGKGSGSPAFSVKARALAQFSGLVAYPVGSGEELEVLIKLSCYDPAGVTAERRQNMLAYLSAFRALDQALLVMRLRESPYVTSERWVRSRTRKSCFICQSGFTLSRRKHHCRLCGDVACSKCSDVHQIKLGKAGKCPFRICAHCEAGGGDMQRSRQSRQLSSVPATPVGGGRRRDGSGSSSSGARARGPEESDEDDARDPSTNSSSGDSSDFYDSRGLLASHVSVGNGGERRTNSSGGHSLSGSHGPSVDASYPSKLSTLSALGKSGSSKTLSISSSNLSNSFYNRSNMSNATTVSSTRSSRFELENDADNEPSEGPGSAAAVATGGAVTSTAAAAEEEEVTSVCSSAPSSPSSAELQAPGGDNFYKRFSEVSLMDFHDSEFDLSLKGGLPADLRVSTRSEFELDDSEADVDSNRDSLEDIGEEEDEDGLDEDGDEDICDFDLRELDEADEDDSGMEFHDSNVGIDFQLQDLNLQSYRGLDELQEEEEDEEIQEITLNGSSALSKSQQASFQDELRVARLTEYGIMDSDKELIYDLVAKQAAQHASCGLATISFVDSRREFIKSSFGVAAARELTDVPREHSLTAEIMRRFPMCKTAPVLEVSIDEDEEEFEEDGELVVVLDALQDDALSTNLFVSESPRLRFVMGVPFRSHDGVVVGALIVADTRARQSVSMRQKSLLKDLAEQITALLEDRRQRNVARAQQAEAEAGPMREQLENLLSQSYSTGMQLKQNERKILQQHSAAMSTPMHQPQYVDDYSGMQGIEL